MNKFVNESDKQLMEYGVLLLSKESIRLINDTLELNYSYSIPFTDIGKAVKVKTSLPGNKKVITFD